MFAENTQMGDVKKKEKHPLTSLRLLPAGFDTKMLTEAGS
jgi:hypothetical protein